MHPMDGIVSVYTLEAGGYGKSRVTELEGCLPSVVLPGVEILWARVLR